MTEHEIFAAAITLTGAQRIAFLDAACGKRGQFRQQIDALLNAHDASGGLLPRQADRELELTQVHATPEKPGTMVAGRYKLLEAIGEGGMGTVWMAEQKEPVKRKVAIKLVKAGMDSAQVLARFEAERQALALMDHPNIAKVFDGGVTEHGRPYFAMEFVKGVPLTEYCNQARLSVRQRLELFVPICQAVQHAHQKGIIHRDLKPSNLLICLYDGKPVPKVIDFGLAKAMHQSLTEQTLHTAFGMMVGTPLYMSPEQAEHNNLDVDTRTDIYSLGVILYELLTGSTPLERRQLKDAAYNEILRLIKEVEPPKPSTRLSGSASLPSIAAQRSIDPNQLRKSLTGDLDWIVMKALDKERSRRYETANGLSRDVERFLHDEAVEACPPSTAYRLKKLLRRNKGRMIAASLILLALVAGTAAVVAVQARANANLRLLNSQLDTANTELKSTNVLLDHQRTRAEKLEKQALDAVKRFGDAVTENPELKNNLALEPLRKALLKEPLTFFLALRDRLQADHDTQPQSLARLASASFDLGRLTSEIGDKQDALRAFQEALAIQERLVRENPTVIEFQYALAVNHNNIGRQKGETGQLAEARASYGRAQAIFERLVEDNPTDVQFLRDLARNLSNIGVLQDETGQVAETLSSHTRAREILERLALENPTVTEIQLDLALSHNNVSAVQNQTGQAAEALASVSRAREILERLALENPTDIRIQTKLAHTHFNASVMLNQDGQSAEALVACRQARDIRERLARENPTVTEFQADLAASQRKIGLLMSQTGQATEALAAYNQAREICERLAQENPTVSRFQAELASSHNSIGELQQRIGHRPEAVASYTRAMEILERLTRETPTLQKRQSDLAAVHNNIGFLMMEMGKPTEAISSYTRGIEIQRQIVRENPDNPHSQSLLAVFHLNIGGAQSRTGQPAEATASYMQAREIQERLVEKHPESLDFASHLGGTLNNIASLDLDAKRFTEARDTLLQAIKWQRRALVVNERNPKYRQFLTNHLRNLIRACQGLDDAEGAADAQRQLAELQASDRRATELALRDYRPAPIFDQAIALMKSGETAKAESKLDECMALAELLHKERSSDTTIFKAWVELTARRGALYYEVGGHEQAVEWLDRAFALIAQFRQRWPAHDVRERLVQMHRDRALALRKLKRDADAISNWNTLLDLVVPTELAWAHFNLGVALCNSGDIVKGDQSLQRGMELREQAVQFAAADDRAPYWYAALYYRDFGRFVMDRPEKTPALALLEKAVASFRSYDQRWPSEEGKLQLRGALELQALVLGWLNRHSEAAESWEQVAEISPVSNRFHPLVQQFRSLELAGKSDVANQLFDKTLAEHERYVNEAGPNAKEPRQSLALLCWSRSKVELETNRPESSFIWLDRAEKEIQPLRERWPGFQMNIYFRNMQLTRIHALIKLRRFEEALPIFERVIELATPQELPLYQSMKICATIRTGQLDGQLEALDILLAAHSDNSAVRFNAARAYALASERDSTRREQLSSRAMKLLTDLARAGQVSHTQLVQDDELASLQGRPDFQKLLSALEPKMESKGP